jgi:hypothetical protein
MLLARGYSAEEIEARGYRSLPPDGRWKIASQCHNGNWSVLSGVPGFFVATNHDGEPFWTIAGAPGLLIPCRDPDGHIRAYRIRPDSQDGGKYRWLSSTDKPNGVGSGVHCHVTRPLTGELQSGTVWITEGEIKSDLAAERLRATLVSIPGVNSWNRALRDIATLLPNGGRIVAAFDADWRKNPTVHEALWSLCQTCNALGYETLTAQWDPKWKGLDDLLIAGMAPELKPITELPEPEWTMKWSTARILADAPAKMPGQAVRLRIIRERLATVLKDLFRLQ